MSYRTGSRNTVFNSVAQSGVEYMQRMAALNIRRFRADLLREPPEQIGPLLDRCARVARCQDGGKRVWRELRLVNQLV